jgi:NAD+ kinase
MLVAWLESQGLSAVVDKETAAVVPDQPVRPVARNELPGQVDFLVVLGGDGTLLSVARSVGALGLPILGVNLGGLGFLTAMTVEEMIPALEAFLAGRLIIEDRMMLETRLRHGGRVVSEALALNDAVIMKAAMSRIIELAVAVDGQFATAYRADGLIISTPTGSTAYSLSAGGPILFPTLDAVILTPVCSHALTNRPIVLPAAQRIEVTLHTSQDVMLTVDGQVGFALEERDTVEVERATSRIRLVRLPQKHFFSVLRTKLKWGER